MWPLRRPSDPRRDPAPSRWAYRMQRLMLTPAFRLTLRAGLPAAAVVAAGALWLGDAERRAHLLGYVAEARAAIESRPEFRVELMAIDGASADLAEEIRATLALDLPTTSFDLDLDALRETVAALAPVESVSLRIRPGGVLQLEVTERVPALVWRSAEGLHLLDAEGHAVRRIAARTDRPDLPLIAGEGANAHVAEARALLSAARPIAPRVRGLVRVGERRWDLVLDRGQRIMLPAERPRRALDRVIAMDGAQDLLARDVTAVDMRLAGRPTLRLAPAAMEEMHRIRRIEWGED
ncbi:cell division protein FtsQ [Rhodosalinus sediminis]|uniref:Cell division protein FtsQ n=1 Tax=Rhodosalinus sediminis TaxID=1940533 RepID=A0A3D9BZE8_9RHOB|nr:cell division protein FtsQ/DivIB [Rhodosalinus sediminis]REC58905.1 cell division protein FtsQ [Rhodosalinus sediminis]